MLAMRQQLELAQREAARFRSQLEARMTPDEKREQEVAAALEFQRTYKAELLKAQLQAYMERRIRETGTSANNAIIELIGGASEAEIEQSIIVATNEYKTIVDAERQKL
jgi:hypothetical protein